MCKMGKYAVVNYQRRKTVLGRWGTPEAKQEYARFITEIENNPLPTIPVSRPGENLPESREGLVSEIAAVYLDYIKDNNIQESDYSLCKATVDDFLLPLFADCLANSFTPKRLKQVRGNMVASKRYCDIHRGKRRIR